jgi:hypothetical protein
MAAGVRSLQKTKDFLMLRNKQELLLNLFYLIQSAVLGKKLFLSHHHLYLMDVYIAVDAYIHHVWITRTRSGHLLTGDVPSGCHRPSYMITTRHQDKLNVDGRSRLFLQNMVMFLCGGLLRVAWAWPLNRR